MYIHTYFLFYFCTDWVEGRQGHSKTKGQQTKPEFKKYVFRNDWC